MFYFIFLFFTIQVHTPDGSPCGLLNHLARNAVLIAFPVTKRPPTTSNGRLVPSLYRSAESGKQVEAFNSERVNSRSHISQLLADLGMVPAGISMGDGQVGPLSFFYKSSC